MKLEQVQRRQPARQLCQIFSADLHDRRTGRRVTQLAVYTDVQA